MKVTFLVGQMRIHLDNLFNGNKVLGASLNMFLNQNAKEGTVDFIETAKKNSISFVQSFIEKNSLNFSDFWAERGFRARTGQYLYRAVEQCL